MKRNRTPAEARQNQPKGRDGPGELPSCSFCGKDEGQVSKLISGWRKHICNECIDRVHIVLAASRNTADTPIATIQQLSAADTAKRCSFCGKQRRHAAAIASTRRARICDECTELCDEIIAEER